MSAFLGLVRGEVAGVLYFDDVANLPDLEPPADWDVESDETYYVWSWVGVDRPRNHVGLPTPPVHTTWDENQIAANQDVAMEDAYRLISGATSGS